MMPFALDLISTFVIGSTLPVATTDFTIVPRSTVANLDGSTLTDAPFSVASPAALATTSTTAPPMYTVFLDFPWVLGTVIPVCDENDAVEVQTPGRPKLRYGVMWILQSPAPADESWTFRLPPGAIKTVGRAPRADFIVDAALVSRLHCRLTATERDVEVVDLSSTNGTYVNDQRVTKATLAVGDRLRVGRVELRVERSAMTDAP